MFCDKLSNLVDQYIPSQYCRRSRDLPWLTPMLRCRMKRKKKLYQQYKRSNSVYYYNRYINLKHRIQKDLRKSYWSYINNMISLDAPDCETDNNSSSFRVNKFWSYIKAIKQNSTSIPSLIQNGDLLTEAPVKAEAFNAQFSLMNLSMISLAKALVRNITIEVYPTYLPI